MGELEAPGAGEYGLTFLLFAHVQPLTARALSSIPNEAHLVTLIIAH